MVALLTNAVKKQIVTSLLTWYDATARNLPWRDDPTPYHVWLSEIMLQQTRVETVIPYYKRFLASIADIESLAKAPLDTLYKLWEGLGYYSRVRHLQAAAKDVCTRFNGRLPDTPEALLSLPGIGRYTAGAIASIAFQKKAAAVDGNVLRVLSRLTGDARNVLTPCVHRDFEALIMSWMAGTQRPGDLTQALIELGALVCKPQDPDCAHCPLSEECAAFCTGRTAQLPVRVKNPSKRVVKKTVLLIRDGERYAIEKNEQPGLLSGLYAFPCVDGFLQMHQAVSYVEKLGCECLRVREAGTSKHIFTHRIWEMAGYERFIAPNAPMAFIWATKEDIAARYAMPSAFSHYLDFIS